MGACAVLGMSDQDVLNEDLESDPFLNATLEVHVQTVLQTWFVPHTSKHWTDYEQALLVGMLWVLKKEDERIQSNNQTVITWIPK